MIEENPASVFLALINKAAQQQRRDGNWRHDSRFARARSQLQSDSRGQVGEEFVAAVLTRLGHSVKNTQSTDPQNKQWDLVVDDKHLWEIKTATMGPKKPQTFNTKTFTRNGDTTALFLWTSRPMIYMYLSFPNMKLTGKLCIAAKIAVFTNGILAKQKLKTRK